MGVSINEYSANTKAAYSEAIGGKLAEIAGKAKDTAVKFDELSNLPAGSIVIWEQNVGVGHISISLGNGSNLTDGIPEGLKLEGKFTVYYPFA